MIYLDLSLTLIKLVTSIFVRPRRGEYWCVSVYVPASDIFIVLITNIDRTWMGKTNRQFRVDMWFKPNKFYGTSAPLLKLLSMFGLASPDWTSRVHLASGVQGKQRVIRCNRKTRFKKKCMVVSLDMFIYVCMQTSNTVPCIMYVCTYIYIYCKIHIYIYTYMCQLLYTIVHQSTYTKSLTCIDLQAHVCIYTYLYISICYIFYIYMYTYVFACILILNIYEYIFTYISVCGWNLERSTDVFCLVLGV